MHPGIAPPAATRQFLVGDPVRVEDHPTVWQVTWVSWTTVEVYHRPSKTRRSYFTVTDDPSQHVDRLRPVDGPGTGHGLDGPA